MPYKDPEKRKAYRRNWYHKNKASEISHVKRRKEELRLWIQEYKKQLSCLHCGENHPATLDFHHVDSLSKDMSISFMVANGYSLDRIIKELEKCDILCANCHRKLHFQEH